jgi:hypothetical protein
VGSFAALLEFSRSYAAAVARARSEGERPVAVPVRPPPAPVAAAASALRAGATAWTTSTPPAPESVALDDTVPVPIRVDPAWFRPTDAADAPRGLASSNPQPEPPPAVDVDSTLGLGAKIVVGPALPFRPQAQPFVPTPAHAAPHPDTGTLWLDRGAPPPAAPEPFAKSRHTVALSGSSSPVAPFTLAPSQAPLAPSTPFRPLSLAEFARVVVTLERGLDPTALLATNGLTIRDWAAISRDMFRRSMTDVAFARDLEAALDRARWGLP